ncbi:9320_t:CDS:2, partial [Acaulospora morrowiae]
FVPLTFEKQTCGGRNIGASFHTPSDRLPENDPEDIDHEKKRLLKGVVPETGNIKGHIKHAPGWNANLASESEAVNFQKIKAEREPNPPTMDHLQRETISYLHDLHEHHDEGRNDDAKKRND